MTDIILANDGKRKSVLDSETNITHVEYVARHDEAPEQKSWKAVERPVLKSQDEKINEMLATDKNLPYPKALQVGNVLYLTDEDIRKLQMPRDKNGHPLYPSNQAKYWKEIRKQRRNKNARI